MTATLAPHQTYSLDEYRQLEETAEARHEYHDGQMTPMPGGTLEHARIIRNLLALLYFALQDTAFEVYGGDLRVWVPAHNRGLYPDLSVIEGEPQLNADRRDEVLNPSLLIEVLSDSTEAYDRGKKFQFYRALPSLQDYLLVSQTEPSIEHYHRTEENCWLFTPYAGLDQTLTLPTGNVEISLAQVYQGVGFAESLA